MNAILVLFHCESDTGNAIGTLDTRSTDPAHVGAACDYVHRQRIVERYSLRIQQQRLADLVRAVCAGQRLRLS